MSPTMLLVSAVVCLLFVAIRQGGATDKYELRMLRKMLLDEMAKREFESREMLTTRGSGLSQGQKNQVVEIHNKLRKQEGSSDMQKISWDDKLAELAQSWADTCNFGHRAFGSYKPQDYGPYMSVGENIWAFSADTNPIPDAPIQAWYDEKKDFNYDSNSCNAVCGHYTQVVWAKTNKVGCGFAKCSSLQVSGSSWPNGVFMVCNYGPGGNVQGEKPFKKGPLCSACDGGSCSDGICDAGGHRFRD